MLLLCFICLYILLYLYTQHQATIFVSILLPGKDSARHHKKEFVLIPWLQVSSLFCVPFLLASSLAGQAEEGPVWSCVFHFLEQKYVLPRTAAHPPVGSHPGVMGVNKMPQEEKVSVLPAEMKNSSAHSLH